MMVDVDYVDVSGVRTRYLTAGDGDPMVLVHGGHFGTRSTAEDWELNFEALSQHFRVIAIDKLGMGFTDNPPSPADYVIDQQAQHLADFLKVMGLKKPHLVGHSRGGYAVTRVALDQPETVATLTVVSSSSVTTPFNPVYAEWRATAATIEDDYEATRYLIEANSYSADHITETMVEAGVASARLDKTRQAKDIMDGGQYERFKADLLERVDQLATEVRAGGLDVPLLILWGYDDPSATLERCLDPALEIFFPNVPGAELHIFNQAGHHCYREQPEAFSETLIGFVRRHQARSV